MPSFTRLARDVAAKIWQVVTAQFQQGWRWLMAPRGPLTWTALRARLTTLRLLPSTYAGRFAVLLGGILLLLLLVLPWYAKGHKDKGGVVTYPNAALINPILAGIGAALLIYAAIRQAQIASNRHEAQTKADLQRRITESFSKAIEQLGSDKLEVRLGGIYALERISQESPQDHWTVVENLTAFVRERTQRTEAERIAKPRDQRIAECAYLLWEYAGKPERRSEEFWAKAIEQESFGGPPVTDIAAVLTVIKRRGEEQRALEAREGRVLGLHQAILRYATLFQAHLEGANLGWAHLEHVNLRSAHLQGAHLTRAHLEHSDLFGSHLEHADLAEAHLQGADLFGAHLEGANLFGAHLEDTNLGWAHFEGADLFGAHLEGVGITLSGAHLQGANLVGVTGLTQQQIDWAFGDAETKLPEGLTRPAHWTQPERGAEPAA
jgi:hypothetical protein